MKAVINVIYLLSIIALLYGGFMFMSNQPSSSSGRNIVGSLLSIGENYAKKEKREQSVIFLIGGAIGIAAAVVMQVSLKNEEKK